MRLSSPVTLRVLPAFLLLAACAATPQGREVQYAKALTTVNNSTVTALDFGIIDASTGDAIQGLTRTATADLKRAVKARRDGAPIAQWERIMGLVESALLEAQRLLGEKK